MGEQHKFPFQNMTAKNWLNLALAGLLFFYLFYLVWDMVMGTLCIQIGMDYCDYWSAGRIANIYGYAGIYNLQLIDQVVHSFQ